MFNIWCIKGQNTCICLHEVQCNPLNQAFLSVLCLFQVNDEGYTPLMEAAREGHEEMVALLLAQGIHIKMFLLQSVSPVKRHWNGGLGRLTVNCFCLWWCRC